MSNKFQSELFFPRISVFFGDERKNRIFKFFTLSPTNCGKFFVNSAQRECVKQLMKWRYVTDCVTQWWFLFMPGVYQNSG